jgi:NYN domain
MRIAVFVDYWNLQLTLNQKLGEQKAEDDFRAKIDWKNLGPVFSTAASAILGTPQGGFSYEGCHIYTSFNPATDEGKKFKNWATTWLDRQPGINVQARERKPKALPRCPVCHKPITHCPHTECGKPIVATVEKGVDTLIATDLIRLAVANAYDAAVLASSDADMLPAVEFVQTLGKKIIQAGFPPKGVDLATECWGSFDVMPLASTIER